MKSRSSDLSPSPGFGKLPGFSTLGAGGFLNAASMSSAHLDMLSSSSPTIQARRHALLLRDLGRDLRPLLFLLLVVEPLLEVGDLVFGCLVRVVGLLKRRRCGSVGLCLLLPLARVLLLGLVQRLVVDGGSWLAPSPPSAPSACVGSFASAMSRHFPCRAARPERRAAAQRFVSWAVARPRQFLMSVRFDMKGPPVGGPCLFALV